MDKLQYYPMTTDHGMLVMDFNFRNSLRVKSYWKANVSVFKDEHFNEDLVRLWDRGVENRSNFDLNWWESIKNKIIRLIQVHSYRLNYIRKGRIIDMCKKINCLLSMEPRPYAKIQALRHEIDKLMAFRVGEIRRRAKLRELNFGEGIMSDLFSSERRKSIQKTMTQLESDSGKVLTNKRDMINFISDFYMKLYAEVLRSCCLP